MFFFGHMGIGSKLVAPWSKGLPRRWVLLGTLLPDLIDKPLYYGMALFTGRHGADLGLVSGTRTFGHTALFLLILSLIAILRSSKPLAALAVGVMTHLLLDNWVEHYFMGKVGADHLALFFPFLGFHFPVMPYGTFSEHL